MKIVYDNIVFSLQKIGGISVYWGELIKRVSGVGKVIFYESKNSNLIGENLSVATKKESTVNYKFLGRIPFLKKIEARSIFHSSYYRVSLQKDVANITTVHDFIYEKFRTGFARHLHVWQKKIAIYRSDGIICISENTKKDLIKLYPNVDEKKIRVIYNGVGKEFKNNKNHLSHKFNELRGKKYILYVGGRSKYKNFDKAIDVLLNMKEYTFVVVGNDFTSEENERLKKINNRTYLFKNILTEELNILYNNAFCLLYPSSYEGFGIPIVEAMKASCPVVSVNRSSIPEISNGCALLVDRIDTDSFIKEILKLENKEFREIQINKGLIQAGKFSWDKCFNETYEFYKEVWNKKFNND